MGANYLIDTNISLEYVSGTLPVKSHNFIQRAINDRFTISVINWIEVLVHESVTQGLIDFMDLANTLQLTNDVEKRTIDLRRQKKIKLPDAIIAATALVHGLTLISRNTKDCQNIVGLDCLNPYEVV